MGDYQISFRGMIGDSFETVSIGKTSVSTTYYLKVTTDMVQICNNKNDMVLYEYSHGINEFRDYICVNIKAGLDGKASFEIMTNGGYFTDTTEWLCNNGNLFVMAGTSTSISECTMSYYCNGWDKDIWLFGDSYFSMTASTRWTTYLLQAGAENIMLNGRSGRGSEAALESLQYDIKFGTPKQIIWCLGMNDGDDDAINEDWLCAICEVQKICEENDIELILCTIPTCPYWNNDIKNEYVKNSGYRYIDFARAVGAYDSITWYENMLEDAEKRIHPTEAGALALYSEAITVVPELLR